MKILINAVSARFGGAKTILDSYINSLDEDEVNSYVIIAGYHFEGVLPDNVKWKKYELNSTFSIAYTLFFVLFC